MRKVLFPIGCILICLLGTVSIFYATSDWDDIKLRLTRFWGYRTIENNPLLPSYDKDIQNVDTAITRIDLNDLLAGGPPKDGIPALENPAFDEATTSPFTDDEIVLGVLLNGEAKAYPYGILNWHEIVNDTVGSIPVSVTYCPLCDTGIVFDRRIDGRETTFGVSGKLYQSCLVMYDRLTDTLWPQPWGIGVVGPHTNQNLTRYPAIKTTLGAWKNAYPNTVVLSPNTGYNRDYFRYPYGSYYTNESLIFPARNLENIADPIKANESIYWEADSQTPQNQFSGLSVRFAWNDVREQKHIVQQVGTRTIEARWDEQLQSVRLYEGDHELPGTTAFAFVYPAFFP